MSTKQNYFLWSLLLSVFFSEQTACIHYKLLAEIKLSMESTFFLSSAVRSAFSRNLAIIIEIDEMAYLLMRKAVPEATISITWGRHVSTVLIN